MPFADEAAKNKGPPGHWDPLHENLHGLADNSAKHYAKLATVDRLLSLR